MSEQLRSATGAKATTVRINSTTCRLTLGNARVVLTVDFRRDSRLHWRQASSTLTVDGQSRPPAQNLDDFARIFQDPDHTGSTSPSPTALPEITPLPPDAELPAMVAHFRAMLRTAARKAEDVTIQVGRREVGYTLAVTSPKATVHINFAPRSRAATAFHLDPREPLRVVDAAGTDLTDQCEGELGQALELLFAQHHQPTGAVPKGVPRDAAVVNAVTVRRTTVLRL